MTTPDMTPYEAYKFRMGQRLVLRAVENGRTEAEGLQDYARWLKHAEDMKLGNFIVSEEDPEGPGMIRGLSQQVLQGVTFGFGDEALGSLYGIISGQGKQAGRDLYRQELQAFEDEHKALAIGAQIAGGIAVPGLGMAGAIGRGGKMAAAGVGAASGGLMGAGMGEGGLSDRARGAIFGTIAGAVAAPVAQAVATKVGSIAANLARRAGPTAKKLLEHLPGSPSRAARAELRRALEADGITPAQAIANAEHRATMGLPSTVADVGGDHTVALARTAQGYRTPEQQAFINELYQRQGDQGARLLADLSRGMRVGLQNADDLADHILAVGQAKAAPLYKEAMAQTVKVTDEMRQVLASPRFRAAYQAAKAHADAEDLAASVNPQAAARYAGRLAVPDLPDDLATMTELPVRALDLLKKGLDTVIEASQKSDAPITNEVGRAFRLTLDRVLKQVDEQVPVYQQARAAAADYLGQTEALQMGREFLKKAPDMVKRELAQSPHPQMYRTGALQALDDKIHGRAGELTQAERFFGSRLFGSGDKTDLARLKVLFDDPVAAQEFADRVAAEAVSVNPRRVTTAASPNPARAAQQFVRPGITQRVAERVGLKTTATEHQVARGREIANEVTNLFTKGLRTPNELVAMLRSLDNLETSARMGRAAVRVGAGIGVDVANPRR